MTKGEECGALESVKAASELYSPVSGKVIQKNDLVEKAPSLINSSPHVRIFKFYFFRTKQIRLLMFYNLFQDEGWLFKVKLSDAAELADLMDDKSYEAYLKTQEDDAH